MKKNKIKLKLIYGFVKIMLVLSTLVLFNLVDWNGKVDINKLKELTGE